MGIFVWLMLPNVSRGFRSALAITGLVTAIATYHYVRIFNSWVGAFTVNNSPKHGEYHVTLTGAPFNDAYRDVDWLLTVPLLLIELILVMKLPREKTVQYSWSLGLGSALMVALGYPGEIQDDLTVRWFGGVVLWFHSHLLSLCLLQDCMVPLPNSQIQSRDL